jgi:hypothetical protein
MADRGPGHPGLSGKPEEELVVRRTRIDDNAVSGDARTAAERFA